MGRGFFSGVLLLALLPLLGAAPAAAQEFNHTITVYATVPEQRAVYLDAIGNIIKIAGNTTRNDIPLQVFDVSNKLVVMTPAIQQQYDEFLKQHKFHLEAGVTYKLNPLRVSAQASTEVIKVDSSQPDPLILTFSAR